MIASRQDRANGPLSSQSAVEDFVQPEPVGQRHLGRRGLERLELLDAVVRLLLQRLAAEGQAADLGQEPGEGRRPLADGGLGRLVVLAGQGRRRARPAPGPSPPRRGGRRPGGFESARSASRLGVDSGDPTSVRSRPCLRRRSRRFEEEGGRPGSSPGQPALDSGRGAYHKTWDIEGSLARRGITPRPIGGTPIGGVAPGPPRPEGSIPRVSEPETAFVVTHDQPNARAAQRRPGAEHRARPVLPEARPTVCRGRADLFYGKSKASASGCREMLRESISRPQRTLEGDRPTRVPTRRGAKEAGEKHRLRGGNRPYWEWPRFSSGTWQTSNSRAIEGRDMDNPSFLPACCRNENATWTPSCTDEPIGRPAVAL